MPVHGALKWQSKRQHTFRIWTISLLEFLVSSLVVIVGILVNPDLTMKRNELTSTFGPGDVLNTGRADVGVVRQRILDATLGASAVRWPTSRILEEVGKQAIDQPGHFLIAAAPIWASRYLVGVPWFGWVAAPILAYREWLQWPSRRWWDPPLDWAFLTLGAVAATCRRQWTHRLLSGSLPVRQRIAREVLLATQARTSAVPQHILPAQHTGLLAQYSTKSRIRAMRSC